MIEANDEDALVCGVIVSRAAVLFVATGPQRTREGKGLGAALICAACLVDIAATSHRLKKRHIPDRALADFGDGHQPRPAQVHQIGPCAPTAMAIGLER